MDTAESATGSPAPHRSDRNEVSAMNTEDKQELERDAQDLAYNAIKLSGLFHSLSGGQWDQLARLMGKRLVEMADDMISIAATMSDTSGGEPVKMDVLSRMISKYGKAA